MRRLLVTAIMLVLFCCKDESERGKPVPLTLDGPTRFVSTYQGSLGFCEMYTITDVATGHEYMALQSRSNGAPTIIRIDPPCQGATQ